MNINKLIPIVLCIYAIAVPYTATAASTPNDVVTRVSGIYAAQKQQPLLLDDGSSISYGLLPNPFKIATAPIRSARAKLKAAKKAAKIAKNASDDGDENGKTKAPSDSYKKTPYTKDRYRGSKNNKKTSERSKHKNYEDYSDDYFLNEDYKKAQNKDGGKPDAK